MPIDTLRDLIEGKKTFQELISEKISELVAAHPFNKDYTTINSLAYHIQEKTELDPKGNKLILLRQRQEELDPENAVEALEGSFIDKEKSTDDEELAEIENEITALKEKHSALYSDHPKIRLLKEINNQIKKLEDIDRNITRLSAAFSSVRLQEEKSSADASLMGSLDLDFTTNSLSDETKQSEDDLLKTQAKSQKLENILENLQKACPNALKKKEKCSTWLTKQFEQFQKEEGEVTLFLTDDVIDLIEKSLEKYSSKKFISFLLSDSKKYLPGFYKVNKNGSSTAEIRFPSSATNKYEAGTAFAHFDIGSNPDSPLLAMNAPMKSDDEKINHDTLQDYLTMLSRTQVSHIVCLDMNYSTASDYKNADCDFFQTTFDSETNTITLRDKTTNETREINYTAIFVEDNEPLNLDNNELRVISSLSEKKYPLNTRAVHCFSGVGRTGEFRLLLALLNKYHNDTVFKSACDGLLSVSALPDLDETQVKARSKNVNVVCDVMSKTLCELRKIRFCVQAEKQFDMKQFLLLVAADQAYDDKNLNQLRENMGVELTAHLPAPLKPKRPADSAAPRHRLLSHKDNKRESLLLPPDSSSAFFFQRATENVSDNTNKLPHAEPSSTLLAD
ncbi:MAG: hypothetical protein NTU49_02760 [Gammaproteobacteria bacterium]|nr:hypothetical protein [Gammaproteobacteria bacterium]